jgi:putative ABC transport system permease protein
MSNRLVSIFRFLFRRPDVERENDTELRFHMEHQIEENIRRGMAPHEARRAARIAIGGTEQIKEECRDARTGRTIETLLQDIRYGVRVLLRNPGFSAMAIITLALGIGANTAIFSVVYGVLLRPLPYQRGGQLVVLHQQASTVHVPDIPFSVHEVTDYREQNHTLDAVVEHHSMTFLLYGKDSAERVAAAVVSANFFDVLGVKALLGRTFVASDERHGADAVLVLSYKYWQAHAHADPNIVGTVYHMNNRPHTVIGVLPPLPQYPAESDVYMPTSQCPFRSDPAFIANRQARMMTVFGRLKPGVPLARAQADVSTIAKQLEKAYPDAYPKGAGYGLALTPLRDDLTRRARAIFLVLLGVAGLVLLIACANVANLFLARLLKLERELAVRAALGAGRLRLMRQLLTESLLLSTAGGTLGLLLAPAAMRLLMKFAERFTTRADEIRLDTPILLFTLLVSLGTGLLFGLAPAFSSIRRPGDALKQAGGRATASRGRERLRAGLVLAQVAVSFMLLIGAGLMIRSFIRLEDVNPGFNPDRVLTLRITPSFSDYTKPGQTKALWDNVLRRVRAIGGVESAALASNYPFSPDGIVNGPGNTTFQIEGRPVSKGDLAPLVDTTVVSEGYFETIRQPLIDGRTFTLHDNADAKLVAVINRTMARHRWPSEDPIGKRLKFNGDDWITIVGIAGDAREYGLGRPVLDEVYLPLDQSPSVDKLVVRTAFQPTSVAPLVRAAIRDIDPRLAVDQIATIDNLRHESVASPRVMAMLMGLFAILALVVSASGIAAVMALSVSQRAHELGVRMALGAQRNSIVYMVVRQGLLLAVGGTAIGIVGALALTRLLASLLFDTSPTDAFTFAAISLLFLAVAALASFIPARQVTAIDPLIALRQE